MGAPVIISFFLLSLQISMGWATFANRCPPQDTIYPGECRVGQLASKISLSVWSNPDGVQNPQELLDRMFLRSREANSATSNDTLDCHNLSTRTLDFENGAWNLTSLDRTSFVFVDIENSFNLSSISDGPRDESTSNSQPATRIRVEYLYLKEHPQFGDEALRDFLLYVDPSALIMLQVTGSALALFPYGQNNEVLTNLQKFPALATLDFTGSKIKAIKTGQFQGLLSLTSVLLKANQIAVIEENGLYFEQPGQVTSTGERKQSKMRSDRLSINFEWNQLTSEGIHENHGLDSTNYRPITLTLSGNHLTSLPEGTWRKFLEAHPDNLLAVANNPLVCGGSTRWLKENRLEFESKVQGADCANDPGQNVFTSNL